jgi:hypothetical protein
MRQLERDREMLPTLVAFAALGLLTAAAGGAPLVAPGGAPALDAAAPSPCGNATQPLTPSAKNVLLIGDSISMTPPYTPGGYGHALELLLTAKGVAVQHAGGNYGGGQCADTRQGLVCTNLTNSAGYLNFAGRFDLIHFNYGLHVRGPLERAPRTPRRQP